MAPKPPDRVDEDEGGQYREEAEDARGVNHVHADLGDTRQEGHPEEIRVSLYPALTVPVGAEAFGQVVRVAEGDEGVISKEVRATRNVEQKERRRAEDGSDGREPGPARVREQSVAAIVATAMAEPVFGLS